METPKVSLFEHVFHTHSPKDVNKLLEEQSTLGQRVSDVVASGMGSWVFIIVQTTIIVLWLLANAWLLRQYPFDPYPFILLNLLFSTQGAYAAPIIMQSQNRQAQKDRLVAENDFKTDTTNADYIKQIILHLNQQDEESLKQTAIIAEIAKKLENRTNIEQNT